MDTVDQTQKISKLAPVQLAFRLLSTLPIAYPKDAKEYLELEGEKCSKYLTIASSIPLVGLVIGVILTLFMVAISMGKLNMNPVLAGLLSLALMLALTRMMHMDALSDVFDASFGAYTPKERIEILKDPHIGVFGLIAIVMALGLYVYSFVEIISYGAVPLIILVMCTSRISASICAYFIIPIESSNLGKTISQKPSAKDFILIFVSLELAIVLSWGYLPLGTLILVLSMTLVVCAFAPQLFARPFEGSNGDVMGASIVASELFMLLLITLLM